MELTAIQKRIIKQLLTQQKTNFNAIWKKSERSNKFAYHLKKLVDSGLVVKEGDDYVLSAKGMVFGSSFSTKNSEVISAPIVAVQLLLRRDGRFLLERRSREPFKDFFGFPSSKVLFGESFQACASRLFEEKFGFRVDNWVVRGFERIVTENSGVVMHDILLYTLEPVDLPELKISDSQRWVAVGDYDSSGTIPAPWISKVFGDDFFSVFAVRRFERGVIIAEELK